jgi:osmotically-inducible protein OsmY
MKYLVILAIGFGIGLYVDRYELRPPAPAPPSPSQIITGKSDQQELDEKIREWHLTPDDIKQDLARTSEVVRNQADAVGAKMSDERILAVVKAKYILDRDLASSDIHVSVNGGRVTLTGSVGSAELLGRAVALALDTGGVSGVDSKLSVTQA